MRSLWNSAWTLLVAANLIWAVNIIVARGISGQVPPITLAYWRWTGAFLLAIGFAWPWLRREWRLFVRHWKLMMLLAATGIASYNTLSYIGLKSTTALNVLLLQSASPLIIILWALVLYGEWPSVRQGAGVLVSLAGVAVIAVHGSLEVLAQMRVNPGDLWVMAALVIYCIYCVIIRHRPAVHPLSFLAVVMGIGSVQMLPFYLWEVSTGAEITGGLTSYLAMAYTAVLPSLVAYMLFNRGLELAGPGPAGQSMHLIPMFGSVLAVVILHEAFEPYHAAGIGLIAAGILLASVNRLPRWRLVRQT